MKSSKETIGRSFSKAADTYDLHSDLQKEVAGWLADRVRAFMDLQATARSMDRCGQEVGAAAGTTTYSPSGKIKVLDIGCGTGNMAVLLGGILARAAIYSTDLALPMLQKTRERLGVDTLLIASDCEALPFIDAPFDVIISSLAYQWAHDTLKAFKEAARVLKPGGRVFLATLGPQTLKELRDCYGEASEDKRYPGPEGYPGADALRSFLKEAGLEPSSMERHIVVRRYASVYSLIRTLKMIGAAPGQNNMTGRTASDMTLRKAGRVYAERFAAPKGGVIATYEVILVTAEKS